MNTKAEQYNAFIKEKEVKIWYKVTEVENNPLHAVVYEAVMEIEQQKLPTHLVIDDSIFVMLHVRLAAAVVKESNRSVLIERLNELNGRYKVFKYYISATGDIVIESCIPSGPQNFDCNMIHVVIDVILRHLVGDQQNVGEYKNIMKLVWSN